MRGTIQPHVLQDLAQAVQALPAQLNAEQAQAALGQVLKAMRGIITDPEAPRYASQALAQAVQALAPKLSAEQAQAALGQVLEAMTGTTNSDALRALAQAVQALPAQLSAEQAQAALGQVLEAMTGTTNSGALQALAQAVQALTPKLATVKVNALNVARLGIGTARSATEALAWASAVEALLPPPPANNYVGEIIEILKYPTAALRNEHARDGQPASATEYLIGKIRERFPNARELQDSSLNSTLNWIAQNYPEIDLVRPPVRPSPR
jgi:hypothetical protein